MERPGRARGYGARVVERAEIFQRFAGVDSANGTAITKLCRNIVVPKDQTDWFIHGHVRRRENRVPLRFR